MKDRETTELKIDNLDQVTGGANGTGYNTMPATIIRSFRDPRPKARVQLDSGERVNCYFDLKLSNQLGQELLAPGVRVQVLKISSTYHVKEIIE